MTPVHSSQPPRLVMSEFILRAMGIRPEIIRAACSGGYQYAYGGKLGHQLREQKRLARRHGSAQFN